MWRTGVSRPIEGAGNATQSLHEMPRTANGMTLIELLTTLAVAMLLLGVALPSFQHLLAEHRRVSTVNDLVSAANLARHTAITHRRPVLLCASHDGEHCGSDWQTGWMVFLEPSGWQETDKVPTSQLIQHHSGPHPSLLVMGNRARFRFRPDRRRATNGTWVICRRDRGADGSAVVVAPTGRVRSSRETPAWSDAACR